MSEARFEIVKTFRDPIFAFGVTRFVVVTRFVLSVVTFASAAIRFVVKEFRFEICQTLSDDTFAVTALMVWTPSNPETFRVVTFAFVTTTF